MILIAIGLSLTVGLSLGLLGGGGSILTVPILRYVLGLEGHAAIALSLLVVGTTSLGGLIAHARRRRVQWRTGLVFGVAGMLGAFIAGRLAHHVPAPLLLLAFSLMMFATAFAMLRPRRSASRTAERERTEQTSRPQHLPVTKVLVEGLVVGAVTGLVGAGGGFLVVPALVLLGGLPMDVAVGTSLLVIAMKSLAGFGGYLGHTPVDWTLAALISSAAVLGSFAGGALVSRVSPAALRRGFGWFVIAMAFFILAQEVPPLFGHPASLAIALAVAAVGTGAVFAARRALQPRSGRLGPAVRGALDPPSALSSQGARSAYPRESEPITQR